jgi:hypothetical protein
LKAFIAFHLKLSNPYFKIKEFSFTDEQIDDLDDDLLVEVAAASTNNSKAIQTEEITQGDSSVEQKIVNICNRLRKPGELIMLRARLLSPSRK